VRPDQDTACDEQGTADDRCQNLIKQG
jgi:hypothetical protein